ASLHNGRDGKATFLFGNRHQNTVSWAPHGRFVNLAGFGNLVRYFSFVFPCCLLCTTFD
ncbi:MAG: hypothetical protein ACI8RD_009465, partial [Bacillariaceae sp.]